VLLVKRAAISVWLSIKSNAVSPMRENNTRVASNRLIGHLRELKMRRESVTRSGGKVT
jgi:hypothetical protein